MITNKVAIIGNNNSGNLVFDGGRVKTRLYYNLCLNEGFDTILIDINKFCFHFFKIFADIKKAVKEKSRIVIMAGPKGCRFFLPLVNFLARGKLDNVVFCPLGIGTIDKLLKNKEPSFVNEFIKNNNFGTLEDRKIGSILKKLNFIVLQSPILKQCYEKFYQLNNCVVLNNFRYLETNTTKITKAKSLRICYLSRVSKNKGILDLIHVVSTLNNKGENITLDIYGEFQLNDYEKFLNLCKNGITYKGTINPEETIHTIKKYDLFCLPTKYHGEGIPGAVVESLIAGTPVLISSYNQAREIINEKNGFIFEINNLKSFEETLQKLCLNKESLYKMRASVKETAQKYTYSFNRKIFLKYICGVEK